MTVRRPVSALALSLGLAFAIAGPGVLSPAATGRAAAADPPPSAEAPRPAVPPDGFYVLDPVPPGPSGELLRSLELFAPEGLRQWAVLYRSTGLDGEPIAVSGIVLAPDDPAGAGDAPRPILAMAHGTTGLADECAPSRTTLRPELVFGGIPYARAGWVVAATDYAGLGTQGPHPYLDGPSAARSVLHAALAAQGIPEAAAGDRVGLLGISQGGHAVLWAAESAPAEAPGLHVVGAVAAAPAGDLTEIARWAASPEATRDSWRNDLTVSAAWSEVYGLPLDAMLTPEARALIPLLEDECLVEPGAFPLAGDPTTAPGWAERFAANAPVRSVPVAPVLYLQGTADEQIPVESARVTVERLCELGASIDYRELPGVDHAGSLYDPERLVLAQDWLEDRLAGAAAADTCARG